MFYGQLYKYHKEKENKGQITALNYISELATTTGVDILGWNIIEVFGLGEEADLNKICMGPREINTKFFAKMEKDKGTEVKIKYLSEAQVQEILRVERDLFLEHRSLIDRNIEQNMRNIDGYNRKISDEFTVMKKHRDTLALGKISILPEIDAIIGSGFFKFEVLGSQVVTFKTAPVTISAKRGDGKQFSIPLGTFEVSLDFYRGRISVNPNEGNCYHADRYYHPYINADGAICWGNAATSAGQLISTKKYADLFRLLHSLLVHFDFDTTPYVGIENMEIARAKQDKLEQDKPADGDDDLSYCEHCDSTYHTSDETHGDGECYSTCGHCNEAIPEGGLCECRGAIRERDEDNWEDHEDEDQQEETSDLGLVPTSPTTPAEEPNGPTQTF